jgi:tRNA nucleotidyltransferase (CCA-adding enzyme)
MTAFFVILSKAKNPCCRYHKQDKRLMLEANLPHLSGLLEARLPPDNLVLLRRAGEVAARSHTALLLVGGCVRDLLLARPVLDIDLVAESNANALADRLVAELGWRVAARSQFSTVKLQAGNILIDVATARSETYARPGALPAVSPGTLADDLARRDFAANAVAVYVTPNRFGDVLDPLGGEADIKAKRLRVLHDRSFQDDATRIIRAARYEARLDFRMNAHTEALARRDVSFLDTISPDRLRAELERVLHEPQPEDCLLRLSDLGALNAILPGLAWPRGLHDAVTEARSGGQTPGGDAFWGLLTWHMDAAQSDTLLRRLHLTAQQRAVALGVHHVKAALAQLARPGLAPSGVDALLRDVPEGALHACAIAATEPPPALERLRRYLVEWRSIRPQLSAQHLLALGVPQGPLVGEFLQRLRVHRLDNPAATLTDEETLVREWLKTQS